MSKIPSAPIAVIALASLVAACSSSRFSNQAEQSPSYLTARPDTAPAARQYGWTPPMTRQSPPPYRTSAQAVVVQPGDSLYSIARKHRTTVSQIMQANRLQSYTLTPGQRLLVPST